jgi:hypothetical protein
MPQPTQTALSPDRKQTRRPLTLLHLRDDFKHEWLSNVVSSDGLSFRTDAGANIRGTKWLNAARAFLCTENSALKREWRQAPEVAVALPPMPHLWTIEGEELDNDSNAQ